VVELQEIAAVAVTVLRVVVITAVQIMLQTCILRAVEVVVDLEVLQLICIMTNVMLPIATLIANVNPKSVTNLLSCE